MTRRTSVAGPAWRACGLGLALLALLGLTAAPALAVVYNVTLGSTTAALSAGAGSSAQNFTGAGSWLKVFPPGPKFETYISVASLGTAFTINDIASINYHTLNPVVNPSGVDFYMVLYTNPFLGGDGGFYGRRLTAEPYLTNGYVAPTIGVWNTWSTPAGPNRLTFNDSNHSGNQGFYGAPTLADVQAGTINWATWAGNPTSGTATGGAIDYGSQGVRYVSFQTGSGWASVTSYLDAIQINLKNGNTYNIDLENVADPVVAAQAPATCITPAHPCVEVPVTITRTSATPVRGFSVNLTISANMSLCSPNIVEGTFLNSLPGSFTNFQVVNNGGGIYTVDCAILGLPCGQTALAGTLFKLNLASSIPSGTGTVTINSVTVRDCANGPIAALPGAALSVTINNTAPAAITDLTATQKTIGNGAGPTTGIILSWATGGAGTVKLYRAPFGSYPEYDDDGPVVAPNPAAAPGAPWSLVTVSATSPYVDNGGSTVFFQGFEVDNSQWNVLAGQYTAPRVPSGTNGVTSRTGGFHAQAGQYDLDVDGGSAFTRWGGYSSVFPVGGWTTQVSVYLDCAYAAGAGDKRIDFSSAVNDNAGSFRRDFVFNMGTEATGYVISAGNNAGRGSSFPSNPGHAPVHITTTGWYTLKHTFYDNAGVLACDLQLLSPTNTVVSTWTLSVPADLIATTGGNRYGWFAAQEQPFLAIDDSRLQINTPAQRGFWHYVAFVTDACANVSTVSNMTGGTLNYVLGDVHNGFTAGLGNNRVYNEDISALGASYGLIGEVPVDAVGYLDVGPTLTGSATSRPTPDDRVQFEDLIIYAINYSLTGYQAPHMRALAVAADRDEVSVDAPSGVAAGETFAAHLRMSGAGDIQGLSAQLRWNRAVVEPVRVNTSDWTSGMGGVVFSSAAGNVDAALLGASGRGFAGQGDVATVTFRAIGSGDPGIELASLVARDAANRPVVPGWTAGTTIVVPGASDLMPVAPNPFHDDATLAFALSHEGPVSLAIFDLNGRLVRTLVHENRGAGNYRMTWNGTDDHGNRLQAGLYYARLTAPQFSRSRKLLLIR